MFIQSFRLLLALSLASLISLPALPSYARFGGGGVGRGNFGRGGIGANGFGGDHTAFNRGEGGFGGRETHPNFGGGFNAAGGDRPVVTDHPAYGAGEGAGHGQFPNHSEFPTDGGFGNLNGNRVPQNFDKNSFNGNTYNKTNEYNRNVNVNNVDNGYHGYHPYNNYGYHGGAYGYHPYNGYHPYYGYGAYNPTSMMWTAAGITSLTELTTFLGMSAISSATNGSKNKQPPSYSNITYNNGNVYVDGQATGSASDFYKQAQQLAASAYNTPYASPAGALTGASYPGLGAAGAAAPLLPTASTGVPPGLATGTPDSGQWQQLGTFSLAEPGQSQSNMMLQMQINKDGILHGTYYNQLTMETAPVYGALDKNTQRISWTLGTNPSTVFDAGLADIVKDESSVLVHYSPSNTQRMALVRMKQPPANLSPGTAAPAAPVQNQFQPG